MKRFVLVSVAMMLSFALVAGSAAGAPLRTRKRARLRDGSCVTTSQLKIRARDRLRDGSCVAAAQLKTQGKDRLRDGSCLV